MRLSCEATLRSCRCNRGTGDSCVCEAVDVQGVRGSKVDTCIPCCTFANECMAAGSEKKNVAELVGGGMQSARSQIRAIASTGSHRRQSQACLNMRSRGFLVLRDRASSAPEVAQADSLQL